MSANSATSAAESSATEPVTGAPRLYRLVHGRWIGGVAAGLAEHLGLPKPVVRLAFVVLSFSAGLGLLLYGAFWIVLRTPPDERQGNRRVALELLVALVLGGAVLLFDVRALPLGWWTTPSVLACLGGALVWRQAGETDRERWRRLSRSSLQAGSWDRIAVLRTAAGVVLVFAGGVVILARAGLAQAGVGLAAVVVTVGGLTLITGPWWLELVRRLGEERRERIRNEERADLAAQLHDSVLQTLALIRRNAESPREVARLARMQERELRARLYGSGVSSGQFAAALQSVAAEVEDTYAVAVDVVVVGDRELAPRLEALVAATREALVNAGKHAGVASVSLYAEVTESQASVYVRDRGIGFDPEQIEEDRHGIRGSIVGRLERQHGSAAIRSKPGEGTEVELRVEL